MFEGKIERLHVYVQVVKENRLRNTPDKYFTQLWTFLDNIDKK